MEKVSHDQIAKRAFELWEKQGRPHGQDMELWLLAERDIKGRSSRNPSLSGNAGLTPMDTPKRPAARPRKPKSKA